MKWNRACFNGQKVDLRRRKKKEKVKIFGSSTERGVNFI